MPCGIAVNQQRGGNEPCPWLWCNSGIGLATAVALARSGHTVAGTVRNLDRGQEIRKIAESEKLPIHLFVIDVDDDLSVSAGFAKVVAELGPIDVLVNNAGVPGGGAIEDTTIEEFRRVMETNFFGAVRCIKAVVTGMRERRRGMIVNVTSVAGRVAFAGHGSYAASKWALEAVSEILAQELSPFNVRVAIVEPGVIATPIFSKARPPTSESVYPFRKRLRALFAVSLQKPTPPSVVGDLIREIANGDGRQLRYPAGPDAAPLLKLRASKTDEEVIREAAESDAEYIARMKRDFGFDVVL